MLSLSTAQLVDTWDCGLSRSALGRTETLLALASPETDAAALDALPLGDRERRLLLVRAAAFGPQLTGLVACEACGEPLEFELPVDDLLALLDPHRQALPRARRLRAALSSARRRRLSAKSRKTRQKRRPPGSWPSASLRPSETASRPLRRTAPGRGRGGRQGSGPGRSSG